MSFISEFVTPAVINMAIYMFLSGGLLIASRQFRTNSAASKEEVGQKMVLPSAMSASDNAYHAAYKVTSDATPASVAIIMGGAVIGSVLCLMEMIAGGMILSAVVFAWRYIAVLLCSNRAAREAAADNGSA